MSRRLICLAILCVVPTSFAAAQNRIEIYRGGKAEGGSTKNVIPGQVTKSTDSRKPSAASTEGNSQQNSPQVPLYSPESTAQILASSQRLANQSYDAFRRGLMPLHDHLDQLQLASDAEYRLANGQEGKLAAADRHLTRVRRVVATLNEFPEPFAGGYRADTYLARAIEAQAEFDLASFAGHQNAADAAGTRARNLAERHLLEREYDSSVGLASLPMLAHAAMLTPDGAARGRDVLNRVIKQTRRWNELGAGIGRDDKVSEAEFELARFNFFQAFDAESADGLAASFDAANVASRKMLRQKMQYYQNGTASLYEIARSWKNMRQVMEFAASTKNGVSRELLEQSGSQLNRIAELATAREDRQGRIAADVEYVTLLNTVATAK